MLRISALVLALLAASTLDWNGQAAAHPAAAAEQRMGKITIRSVGDGSPVVLIPGLGSPPAVFDDLVKRLSPTHRLILVQVNGFAGSAPSSSGPEGLLDGVTEELSSWLAAHDIQKPAVIGHSMGGLTAMMLAQRHPAAAGRVMVVDALPFYGMLLGPTATPDAIRPIVEKMRTGLISGKNPPEVPPHMSNSDTGKAKILEWMRASDPATVGEALVEDATTDVRAGLPSLAATPVTVLYAVASPERKAMAESLYREAYKALPSTKLIAIDDSEHFIMLDQPARFVQEVENFLR